MLARLPLPLQLIVFVQVKVTPPHTFRPPRGRSKATARTRRLKRILNWFTGKHSEAEAAQLCPLEGRHYSELVLEHAKDYASELLSDAPLLADTLQPRLYAYRSFATRQAVPVPSFEALRKQWTDTASAPQRQTPQVNEPEPEETRSD